MDLIYAADPILPGVLTNIFVSGDDTIYLVSDRGAAKIRQQEKELSVTRFWDLAIGVDSRAQLWVISKDGARISSWDGNAWNHYEDNSGWLPFKNLKIRNDQFHLLNAPDGSIWVSTGRDLRHFEGRHWAVFPLSRMGFNDSIRKIYQVQLAVDLSTDNNTLWVGLCYLENGRPAGGQGLRYYRDGQWIAIQFEIKNECITTINASRNPVWIGTNHGVYAYQTSTGELVWMPPPDLAEKTSLVIGAVRELPVDRDGVAWPLFNLCGPDGCDLFSMRYRLDGGQWTQVDDIRALSGREMFFDNQNHPWLFAGDEIYGMIRGQITSLAHFQLEDVYQDDDGELWLLGVFHQVHAIWKLGDNDQLFN